MVGSHGTWLWVWGVDRYKLDILNNALFFITNGIHPGHLLQYQGAIEQTNSISSVENKNKNKYFTLEVKLGNTNFKLHNFFDFSLRENFKNFNFFYLYFIKSNENFGLFFKTLYF